MTATIGTRILDAIVPPDTTDVFPTHYEEYGEGGWRSLGSLAAAADIPVARRKLGMCVWVRNEDRAYILTSSVNSPVWLPLPGNLSGTYAAAGGVSPATGYVTTKDLEGTTLQALVRTPPAAQDPIVILAAGQSNNIGNGSGGPFPQNPNVLFWDWTTQAFLVPDLQIVGYPIEPAGADSPSVAGDEQDDDNGHNCAAIAFGNRLWLETGRTVYVVLTGHGGKSIGNWVDTDGGGADTRPYYDVMKSTVETALAAIGRSTIDVFMWGQGEANSDNSQGTYESAFIPLLASLRTESWFPATTPFIAQQMLQDPVNGFPLSAANGVQGGGVQRALTALNSNGDLYTGVALSYDLTTSTADVHYDGESLWTLGYERYWDAYAAIKARTNALDPPATMRLGTPGAPFADLYTGGLSMIPPVSVTPTRYGEVAFSLPVPDPSIVNDDTLQISVRTRVAYDVETVRIPMAGTLLGTRGNRKNGQTQRISTNVLEDDPDLFILGIEPGVYKMIAQLFYNSDAAADFKIGWTFTGTYDGNPAAATMTWEPGGLPVGAAASAGSIMKDALGLVGNPKYGGLGIGTDLVASPLGLLVVTSKGDLRLQWAQDNITAVNTSLLAKSWIGVEQLVLT